MTRLPRDVDADQLVRALVRLGYTIKRQTGSHIRLETSAGRAGAVSIPNHSPLKVGALHAILREVASQQDMTIADLVAVLRL